MTHGICDICEMWIHDFLRESGFNSQVPMRLNCDSKVTINITHDPVQRDRTKHNVVDRHYQGEGAN